MSKPSAALQQWLRFRQSLSTTPPNILTPRATRLILPTFLNGTTTSRRPFHNTHYRPAKTNRDARPAPSLRRQKRRVESGQEPARISADGVGVLNNKGFYMGSITMNLDALLVRFQVMAEAMYNDASDRGLLPEISFRTFEDVTIKLYKGINANGTPNAQLIRSISTDVDAVFRIGFVACVPHPPLLEWIISACAMAGARQPIVLVQNRLVSWSQTPPRTKWTDLVKQFSDEGFPPAMILQAKILGMRGEYEEAFELMEKRVLPYLTPTRRQPPVFTDITMSDKFESPWRVYALLHASYDDKFDSLESRRKSDDATRIAALEYNDPQALVEYASIMMNEKNYDKYEECMSKAATFGDRNAMLYIANFYYQIFHGRYPTQAERVALAKAESEGQLVRAHALAAPSPSPSTSAAKANANILDSLFAWISSFFNQTMPRGDYQKLALDWYTLASKFAVPQATFMLALMAREQGYSPDVSIVMDHAFDQWVKDPELAKKIAQLRENWHDPEYVPMLSSKMLAVR